MKDSISTGIADLSRWIDKANIHRDPEAVTWGRLSKVAEECGEVIQAYIGVTGQNPRKGIHGSMSNVEKELLDVAVTALSAWEHVTGHSEECITALACHVDYLLDRINDVDSSQV